MRVLMHICCGPCLIAPLEALRAEGMEAEGLFYNPNIHPFLEFRKRAKALRVFLERDALPVEMDEEYGLDLFLKEVYHPDRRTRCERCYRLRLRRTAQRARAQGFEAFTTTLLVSPHQLHDVVREVGQETAQEAGVAFLYRDFRPLFEGGRESARRRQLYLQSYCGCVFSEYERYRESGKEIYRGNGDGNGNGSVTTKAQRAQRTTGTGS